MTVTDTIPMTLSIRWKVTIGALLVLACGLLIARVLVIRSLDQQEVLQSARYWRLEPISSHTGCNRF